MKKLDVALQGGGAHGALTWGVLERLLEDERIIIEGICGTSAGAMNGAMVAAGLMEGGRQGAIDKLETFWRRVSHWHVFSPAQPSLWDFWFGNAATNGNMEYSPMYLMTQAATLVSSPYQLNPLNFNPLRGILLELVDFESLQSCDKTCLLVCATEVRTSKGRIFTGDDLTVDAILASACIPHMFQAVIIDGEAYWDGGFLGNPPLLPLIQSTDTDDVLLVQINPIHIERVPQTAGEIRDRVNELSFNTSLLHELRLVDLLSRLWKDGKIMEGVVPGFREFHLHAINPEAMMDNHGASSKINASWWYLQGLRQKGYELADAWLEEHYEAIGVRSTCNLFDLFY